MLQTNDCAYNRPCSCRNSERCRSFKRRSCRRKNTENADTTVSSLFRRFRIWLNSKWKVHETFDGPLRNGSPRSSRLRDTTIDSGSDFDASIVLQNRVGLYCSDSTIISDTDDPNYVYIRNKTATSEESGNDSSTSCTVQYLKVPSPTTGPSNNRSQSKQKQFLQVRQADDKKHPLTVTTSCPGKSHSTSRQFGSQNDSSDIEFFGTWPMSRKRQRLSEGRQQFTGHYFYPSS